VLASPISSDSAEPLDESVQLAEVLLVEPPALFHQLSHPAEPELELHLGLFESTDVPVAETDNVLSGK